MQAIVPTVRRSIFTAYRTYNSQKLIACLCPAAKPRLFSISAYTRAGRKFTEKHEWVVADGKNATIGISQYAQEALGDVVYVQLPDIGTEFNQHDECGAVESVKAASEIYTPVSGKVTETNLKLEDEPGLVNKSCYDKGWLFKVELTKPEELDHLLDEDAYNKFLQSLDE